MPLPVLIAFAVISLIGLGVAVVTTVRAEARPRRRRSPRRSPYRAYGT